MDYKTKVKTMFTGSVLAPPSIPMSNRSHNWIWFFLEFWLVKKFKLKKILFPPIWRIQQRTIEFLQHQYRLLSRFEWAIDPMIEIDFFSKSDWSKNFFVKKIFSHGFREYNNAQYYFFSITVHSFVDFNGEKVEELNLNFSQILIGRKILMEKKFILSDFENTTKVKRIFSALVFTHLMIPMNKRSLNSSLFFLEIWLVENFDEKKLFFSPISRIQEMSIEFFQHQCVTYRNSVSSELWTLQILRKRECMMF